MTASIALVLLLSLLQNVETRADFTAVSGDSLKSRYENAVAQGRRGETGTFWVAYRFPVRPGMRVDARDGGININRGGYADGIEFIDRSTSAENVGLLILVRKSDDRIENTRILNLNESFRVHDRKVYWIGEPNAEESLGLLTTLAGRTPRQSSQFVMTMSLHPVPQATSALLALARNSPSMEVRKNAVFWIGQEVSRQAGEELEKMANNDPEVEIQKQAVFAISRRTADESIPALIRIAKEHPNAAVRSQAIFWLGQKRDPRVLDVFEQMLKK